MNISLQEVYDSFFIKIPSHDFTGEESLVYQLFKTAIAYASDTSSENLSYTLSNSEDSYDGVFNNDVSQKTIELVSLYMSKEYLRRQINKFEAQKQHVGTKNFNKLPNFKDEFDSVNKLFKSVCDEITLFRQEFYLFGG